MNGIIISALFIRIQEEMYHHPVDSNWRRSACRLLQLLDVIIPYDETFKTNQSRILGYPKDITSITGDGNCYYRCISVAVTGNQDHHKSIRSAIVAFLLGSIEVQMLHLPENLSVDEYVKENKVDELGTWATEVEIAATAGLLQTNIYCFAQFEMKQ